jgi:transposase-like protein
MGKGYPPEFRQRVIELVEGGRRVADVAADLGVSEQTVCTGRRLARVDRGEEAGITTVERAELAATKPTTSSPQSAAQIQSGRRIADLLDCSLRDTQIRSRSLHPSCAVTAASIRRARPKARR